MNVFDDRTPTAIYGYQLKLPYPGTPEYQQYLSEQLMKAAQPEVLAATRVNPGETLRQARENNGWALAEVALKLNLTVSSLSNLENGAFDKLPGHAFARGYIRTYAKFLGIEQTNLVHAFDLYTGTDANGSNVYGLGCIEEPVRASHTILRIVSLLLLIVVISGGFIWWEEQAFMRAKDLTRLNPKHVEVEGADGTIRTHPLDAPEDQAVAEAKIEGEVPMVAYAAPEQNTTAVPLTTGTVKAAVAKVAVSPAAPVAGPAAIAVMAPVAGADKVALQFTADCWTQVTDGAGKVLFSGLKRKGESLELSGKPPLSLRLGYVRGVQVTYNSQPVDMALFTSGETIRLK